MDKTKKLMTLTKAYYAILMPLCIIKMIFNILSNRYHMQRVSDEKYLSYFRNETIVFAVVLIAILALSVLTLLKTVKQNKQNALGLSLVMFMVTADYAVLFILNQFYIEGFYSGYLIESIIALAASIIIFLAHKLNKLPLKVIGCVMIVLIALYFAFIIIVTIIDYKLTLLTVLSLIYRFAYIPVLVLSAILLFSKEILEKKKASSVTVPFNYTETVNNGPGNAEMLLKYKELLDMGAITQEEFEAKKKELLD